MSNYSQRFLKNHQYIANLLEDILAYTLCLPFTMMLMNWSDLSGMVSDGISENNNIDKMIWNPGKIALTFPLYLLKGLSKILITPLSALISLFPRDKGKYQFELYKKERKHVKKINYAKFAIYLGILLYISPVIFCGVLGSTLGLSLACNLYKRLSNKEANYIIILLQVLLGLTYYAIEAYVILQGIFLLQNFIQPLATLLAPLSSPVLVTLMAVLWGIGCKPEFEVWLAQSLNFVITKCQQVLFSIGFNSYKNINDLSLTHITEVPYNDLFISNTNHAFNLSDLQNNSKISGLQNFYINDKKVMLDENDIENLRKHSRINHFPHLKKFIDDYKKNKQGIISDKSIQMLRSFSQEILKSQTENGANEKTFAENILAAKQKLDQNITALPSHERKSILEMNLQGGMDKEYQFDYILIKTCEGKFCKKSTSKLLDQTLDRIAQQGVNEDFKPFWQALRPNRDAML